GIDAALQGLQVIAFLQALGDKTLWRFNLGPFQRPRRRLQGGRGPVGPHDSSLLDAGVGFLFDVPLGAALFRLIRPLDALTSHVIFPAVVGAAPPAFLILAKPERDTAMRAELVDKADTPFTVAKAD